MRRGGHGIMVIFQITNGENTELGNITGKLSIRDLTIVFVNNGRFN